jgi:protein-L-isoaspartate O-methyltransferase
MITALRDLTALVGDDLTDSWRPAFTATPRELFIPDRALWVRGGDVKIPIDRYTDPDTWMTAVYSNDFIVTQVDDGVAGGEGDCTSSSSMPSIMLVMLNALDVHEGQRTLEIGTGTGYNAAAGYSPRAPYDRIIATCSVETVPWEWGAQTRSAGVIVTPWGPPMANDHLLRLEVSPDNAVGTIVGSVGFMRLRVQRWHITDEPDDFPYIAARSCTDLDPREVFGNHSTLAVALRLGECRWIFETDPTNGSEILWLLSGDSWASISGGQVRQAGARNLWDEAVVAYQWWITQDRPDRHQFHLTVTGERQWVWLDDPANPVTTLA